MVNAKKCDRCGEFYSIKSACEYAKTLSNDPGFDSAKFEVQIEHISTNPDMYEVVVLPILIRNKLGETK